MKNRLTLGILVLAAVALVATGPAAAQTLVNATTGAEMVAALSVTQDQELNFGGFVPQVSGGGTITVAQDGTRSRTGTGQLDANIPGTAGVFTITSPFGNWSAIYSAPTALTGAGAPMPVTLITTAAGTITGGTATFNVGGTLTVGNNQVQGIYAGTYTVTVTGTP